MRRVILTMMNIFIFYFWANAQTGIWSGELDVQGVKLPLVFHLDDENPTIDSPAQKARGIPAQITRTDPDGIFVEISAIGATFKGKYGNNEIAGTFTQRGMEFPMTLVPGEKISQRPQTPKPPYPYSQEDVCFENGDAVLKGTLVLPEGYDQNTPVIIMITGSGLQNRDEEIFDHKPFAVIADALARNGIASLRYDDRGYGESSGDAVNCTTEDLKNDALSGIKLLRKRFKKVGVLGHSEGGTIALMLGADKQADFVISLAGMIVSGKETLLDQNRYSLSLAGYPQHVIDDYCRILSLAFDGEQSVLQELDSSDIPAELKQNLQPALWQLKTPYMQYFLALDIRDILVNITCPVLALNGTKDTQVFQKNNLDALIKGLPSNASSNEIIALDNLNHLFQNCTTGSLNEYATIEETISPEVLKKISGWISTLK